MAWPSRTGKRSAAKSRKGKGRRSGKPRRRAPSNSPRKQKADLDLEEARRQQAATAEILSVIANSASNVQPVFEAIAHNANRLMGGFSTAVYRFIDGIAYLSAFTPTSPAADQVLKNAYPRPATSIPQFALAAAGKAFQISDLDELPPEVRQIAIARGWRSSLGVPLRSNEATIGLITITRKKAGSFPDHHVQLLQVFANQAVIAIENARLFSETKEALERQTATAEILEIINRTPGNLTPVFEKVLEKATQLCEASFGGLTLYLGNDMHRGVANRNMPPAVADLVMNDPFYLGPETGIGRLVRGESFVHILDAADDEGYRRGNPVRRAMVDIAGTRTYLAIPLRKDDALLGAFTIYRREVRPFTDRQISLLQSFAAQAVIAIENARLFNEVQARTRDLTESLQQQTATADLLQVISRSAFDLQPIFDAIAERAVTLCGADRAFIFRFDGELLRMVTAYNAPPDFREWVAQHPIRPGRHSASARAALERRTIHIHDVREDAEYTYGVKDAEDIRTVLGVPILKSSELLGVMMIYHLEGVRPFTERQIELVQTFADQAVIAIENTRLFNETKEALARQTATADVLRVIATSPSKLQPVFDAIAERSKALIGAHSTAVARYIDGKIELAAFTPVSPEGDAALLALFPMQLDFDDEQFALVLRGEVARIGDAESEIENSALRDMARSRGWRSRLLVPLKNDGGVIGWISIARREAGEFAEKDVELLQTFADQAVIAIKNVELFEEVQARTRELQESLRQQTATSEVLKVISGSLGELKPVFSSMLENAVSICDAKFGNLFLVDGDSARWEAGVGTPPKLVEYFTQSKSFQPTPGSHLDRVMRTKQVSHTADDMAEVVVGAAARFGGARSTVCVPMVKDDALVGAIFIYRTEVRPFTDKQIDVVKNFASQAVIAIENARLLNELRERTNDLQESLQQQTATADVLHVISSSPGDVTLVFDKMLENAVQVCGAEFGVMNLVEKDAMRHVALFNVPAEFAAVRINKVFVPHPKSPLANAVASKSIVHVADLRETISYLECAPATVELVELGGARTIITVPMLRDSDVVGAMTIYRNEVRPFGDKQIELLNNFAKQAVIAIENARLLKELRQRTNDLSKSLDDLRTAQDRLIQTEKLASLGQLTAGIAHEIKNPLNFVNNFSQLSAELVDEMTEIFENPALDEASRWKELDEIRELLKGNLEKVVQHGKRADSIVKNMLLHSREGSGELRAADINSLVEESLNLAYHGARAEKSGFNITLQRQFDASAGEAELFPQEITRALLNLISNGFYAATRRTAEDGAEAIEPTLLASTKNLGASVEIRIRDNGTGIPPEVKEKIFNPFFTTKPAGEGTGLGLSMTHDIIVKQHGGTITVDTEPGEYTEFIITLPRATSAPANQRSTR